MSQSNNETQQGVSGARQIVERQPGLAGQYQVAYNPERDALFDHRAPYRSRYKFDKNGSVNPVLQFLPASHIRFLRRIGMHPFGDKENDAGDPFYWEAHCDETP